MDDALSARFAQNVKQLRDARGMTQQQMAKLAGLPRATWATEVTKMRNVYKAPISDGDAALIVDYLAATHAPP